MTTDYDLLKLNCFVEDAPGLSPAYICDVYVCPTNFPNDADVFSQAPQTFSIENADYGCCSGTANTTT